MRKIIVLKGYLLVIVLCLTQFNNSVLAQKVYTKAGKISFYSKASLENIEAVNKTVTAILDTKNGALQFGVQLKGFEFEKALMQEHFNENYVESDKYPKANFSGMVLENNKINYTKDASYETTVKGMLTIHGISKEVQVTGKIVILKGVPELLAIFNILLSDYNITIPSIVKDKVSKNVKLSVACLLDNVLK